MLVMQFHGKLLGTIRKCLKPIASDLILVGDNFPLNGGKSDELLKYVSTNWNRVFVVPGLTEIIGVEPSSFTTNIDELQKFLLTSPRSNVYMLNNSEFHDGNHMIVGSTFWCGSNSKISEPQTRILANWAKDDAEFIGTSIKMAVTHNKILTVATYFPNNNLSPAVQHIMRKHLEGLDIKQNIGKWVSGYNYPLM
jgi:hypothetical protein